MPRYFFHTADGSVDRDTEGTELPTLGAARKQAVHYASDVMRDQHDVFWTGTNFVIVVTDELQTTLFTVTVHASDAIDAPSAE